MRLLGLLVLVLVLAACTPLQTEAPPTAAPTTPPSAGDGLAGSRWTLVSFGAPGAQTPVIEGTKVTLEFRAGGAVAGSGGCNSYGGQYVTEDGAISFREIVHTEMACLAEGVMEQEQRFFEALSSASGFERSGDRLAISYDNGNGVLNLLGAATTSPTPDV